VLIPSSELIDRAKTFSSVPPLVSLVLAICYQHL
jgi:hypothetical protein